MAKRPNLVLAVIAALVVVLAVTVAMVSASRAKPEFDRSSPAGVVQLYISELHEGNLEATVALLDPELGCTPDNLANYGLSDSLRLRVLKETVTGERASVRLEITEGIGQLFGGEWTHEETFSLIKDGDSWLVSGSPWPVYYCDTDKPLG